MHLKKSRGVYLITIGLMALLLLLSSCAKTDYQASKGRPAIQLEAVQLSAERATFHAKVSETQTTAPTSAQPILQFRIANSAKQPDGSYRAIHYNSDEPCPTNFEKFPISKSDSSDFLGAKYQEKKYHKKNLNFMCLSKTVALSDQSITSAVAGIDTQETGRPVVNIVAQGNEISNWQKITRENVDKPLSTVYFDIKQKAPSGAKAKKQDNGTKAVVGQVISTANIGMGLSNRFQITFGNGQLPQAQALARELQEAIKQRRIHKDNGTRVD
jgi:preprotein translocase subunit SecD